ncbi:excinuclease ABC subunit B [Rhodobacterales bacterium HKCCE3408]|nr:excinuclease ABC subunit B [Rhodobacterales bacterium HKCCE3408]
MRVALVLICLALPAQAWKAGVSDGICTLSHETANVSVQLTYDPALPQYAITVTGPDDWPDAPVFAMHFLGGRELFISTDRHVIDGPALTVTDRGFGNVLDGLEFNTRAVAASGGAAVDIPLDGAAPAVAAFRACTTAPTA